MTDRRYFYTDSLAAAWMAKHFRMKIETGGKAANVEAAYTTFPEVLLMEEFRGKRLYVHPDSLRLLDPQEGDEGVDAIGRQVIYMEGNWRVPVPAELEFIGKLITILRVKIDKRGGAAFIAPESEAI